MPPTSRPVASRPTRPGVAPGGKVALALAWAIGAGAPLPLAGQAVEAATAASAEASVALTTVVGELSWMGSGEVLVDLTPRFSLGGAGSFLLSARSLPGATRGNDRELRIAFGGLVAQVELSRGKGRRFWLRVLSGAGNAKVSLALVGTQIASDNFGVLAPEVGASLPLIGPLRAGAALG
ncbi:MAG: hypothetical protein FIA95_16450 [Gemmatimonadetes bacterium]|nr:hypothetical protein [Gemmatimonadota bacterium]